MRLAVPLVRVATALACGLSLATTTGCDVRVKALDSPGCPGDAWTPEPARMSDDVVKALSVGLHLGLAKPPTDNLALVRQRVGELGVRHVVDPSQPELALVQELGAQGIRAQLWIGALGPYLNAVLAAGDAVDAIQIDPLEDALKKNDASWLPERRNFCAELFAAVKGARPGTVAVVGPDVGLSADYPLTDFGPCVDFGIVHRPVTAAPPAAGGELDDQLRLQRPRSSNRPLMLGLDGYSTAQGAAAAVSETVQAKYLLRLIFEAYNRGFARVHLGDLLDRGDDRQSLAANQGLVRLDGVPKPSFIATQSLIALLADPGESFTTGGLAYRIDGATDALHHTLLQKRDGTFFLVLWLETTSTAGDSARTVTLRFPSPAAQVGVHVPKDSLTTGPQASAAGVLQPRVHVSHLTVTVLDQVAVVQIVPCGS